MQPPAFFRDQPRGVYLIFSIEFWERFSYYGFIGILVLWLTASPLSGGLGWEAADALPIVGWVTGILWLAPIAGGYVADRWLGAKRSVTLGAVGLGAGNALLAAAAFLPGLILDKSQLASGDALGTWADHHGAAGTLISAALTLGLLTMILGAGMFKANASSLLNQEFDADDPRRNKGFTLFYMGINLGAMAAPLAAGTVAEGIGWGWGFATASIGMLVGIIMFERLARAWLRPAPVRQGTEAADATSSERGGIWLALVMVPFATIFMTGLLQYSGLLNLFTAEKVGRSVGGLTVPATWFLSINPFVILLFGPVVASIWMRMDKRYSRDIFAVKIATGLALMAMAYGTLALFTGLAGEAPVSPLVMALFWLILTLGELCVVPIGLSLMGRIAPRNAVGTLMGVWLLTMGIGSVIAGRLGALAQSWGEIAIFQFTAVLGAASAFVLLMCAKPLHLWADRLIEGEQPQPADPHRANQPNRGAVTEPDL